MAKRLEDLTVTVNVSLTVTDEMAQRCLRLLEMWQADNPDKKIEGEWTEPNRVKFRIVPFEAALGGDHDAAD